MAQTACAAAAVQLGWSIGSLGFISLFLGQFAGAMWVMNHLGRHHSAVFQDRPTTVSWCRVSALLQSLAAGCAYATWALNAEPSALGTASIPAGVSGAAVICGASGAVTALIAADISRHWYAPEDDRAS